MANKPRDKTYYRVTFTNESTADHELFQVCARQVSASDLYGLLEISEFIFPESPIVYNPGEERIRREFGNVKRTWVPYHAIVRIDEVPDSTASEIRVVSLESVRQTSERRMIKKPD
jgi:hypothetical protein